MVTHLYIHIPFCISKCSYCDFYSVAAGHSGPGDSSEYVNLLLKEMGLRRNIARNLGTIYLGGGTPTLLPAAQTATILSAARETFSVASGAEITIEANPRTISEEKLADLRGAGINRISIGVQSFDDRELYTLGRSHRAEDAFSAVKSARTAGFDNISLDLIYGIPGQDLNGWRETVARALELSPDHVSTYELTPEKDTPLYRNLARGEYSLPDELLVTEMYYSAIEIMEAERYLHYEISNFAKPSYESVHNLNYWDRGEYLGLGAGAHSFFDGKRTGNIRDLTRYKEAVSCSLTASDEETFISADDEFNEMVFLGLRKTEGIDMRRAADTDIERLLKNRAMDELIKLGLIEIRDNYLRLTLKGLVLSSEIMAQILK
jgi:oxygen-independent coproporphyrinogen-3 oxidase